MGMMTVAQLQTHVYEDKMKNVEMLTPLLWADEGIPRGFRLSAGNVRLPV